MELTLDLLYYMYDTAQTSRPWCSTEYAMKPSVHISSFSKTSERVWILLLFLKTWSCLPAPECTSDVLSGELVFRRSRNRACVVVELAENYFTHCPVSHTCIILQLVHRDSE